MSNFMTTTNTFLLLFLFLSSTTTLALEDLEAVQAAQAIVLDAKGWVQEHMSKINQSDRNILVGAALSDCNRFYDENEYNLAKLVSGENHTVDDAKTWLSGALTKHRSCIDGLSKGGFSQGFEGAKKLTTLLGDALALYDKRRRPRKGREHHGRSGLGGGVLGNWNPRTSRANFVVSQDGSGTHTTIRDAIEAVTRLEKHRKRTRRVIVYVKAGVYHERVEIHKDIHNLMIVGDGMDKTVITGNNTIQMGLSPSRCATFVVSGEGFWARDMTFQNTAGPRSEAIAAMVSSDKSVFYRCSFKGYKRTLFAHVHRQFYRDCHIYGTLDFIHGDAASVFQNCDILVRGVPDDQETIVITTQNRANRRENTGISILESRVRPTPEFAKVKHHVRSYLGRPRKEYSRIVFAKTNIDGLIDRKGWIPWAGSYALSTLYFGEYMNTGAGANTSRRVKWLGYHVLRTAREVSPFSVENLIQGDLWLPQTGVPFNLRV